MKFVAWILVILLLALVGGGVYLYMNTNIAISAIAMATTPAPQWEGPFNEYKSGLQSGAALGTIFDPAPIGDINDYVFNTYTVTLSNNSFIPAEMAEVQVVPVQGDVLQTLTANITNIPARSSAQIAATVLARKDVHQVRQIIVTYYLWGYYFTLTKTYG